MKKGFTLVELLAVIIILGILAAISIPSVVKLIDNAQGNADRQTVNELVKGAKEYYAMYPELIPAYQDPTITPTMNKLSKLLSTNIINQLDENSCGYFYVLYDKGNTTDYSVYVEYIVGEGTKSQVYCGGTNNFCTEGQKNTNLCKQ